MSNADYVDGLMPQGGDVVVHRKGGQYLVLGVGQHSENLTTMVAYMPLSDDTDTEMWFRPLGMFVGRVELPVFAARFKRVGHLESFESVLNSLRRGAALIARTADSPDPR